METAEIRRRFLAHFQRHEHSIVASTSLLVDDPTLLFVSAGMVPFKPYFLGQQTPPYPRAASVQKCVRTTDIEEVGRTTRHGTFFQMNGNFSFGDYFKEGAIELAWELCTRTQSDGGYGFDESQLWVTVYHDDDEAIALWKRIAGLPDERIVRLGKKDNYWHMGVPGPGGPCSEILLDRGPAYGPEGDVEKAGDRYLEFWNLVFMQENLSAVRSKEDFDVAGPLPNRNIDTGMGLERVAFLLQDKDNIYEIDEIFPVIAKAAELSGRPYGEDASDDVRFRVVADHVRSSLMLIGDGVTPGNESRGYVLRRLLRRVVRCMRLLGVEEPTLPELLPVSKAKMALSYPEIEHDWARISQIAYAEEQAFRQTLRTGTQIFDLAAARAKQSGTTELSGAEAFSLHDTFGFPIDLTLEMAGEHGLAVDEVGFRQLMAEQRSRAKADAQRKKGQHADAGAYRSAADTLDAAVAFTGYDEVASEAQVRALIAGDTTAAAAEEGDEVEVVLDRTPFYAEGGGQLADHGVVQLAGGAVLDVVDVQSPISGLIVHRARVRSGSVRVGEAAHAFVDQERRRSISRSHTATHMVHKAIREALGDTATQAGSENSPGRFRFDFAASGAVPTSVLADVEARVNDLVLADLGVHAEVMTQQQARSAGAMALFGEKYGDQVRVVSVGDWARELCGGTHAGRSGQLGVIKLLGESSIGSGVRRVEALVGSDAYRFLAREHVLVAQLSDLLKAAPQDLPQRVNDLVERLRTAEKEIERVRVQALLAAAGQLAAAAADVAGTAFVGHLADGAGAADVRKLALDVRGRLPGERPGAVAVVGVTDGRPAIVVAVNDAARHAGLSAKALVKAAAPILGGSGGGKDDVAQGGGTDPTRAGEALAAVEAALREQRPGS
jgi:alanyl-tRNA synthetase